MIGRKILAACAALSLVGCMSAAEQDRRAKDVVEAMGFTHVEMTGSGVGLFASACGEDTYCRSWQGIAPNGSRVAGVAGSDDYKGWTVRVTGVAKVTYSGEPSTAIIQSAVTGAPVVASAE